jgi:hypothetical protein
LVPAVDRARLAHQVEQVAAAVAEPAVFRRRFQDLMEFYADRTRRPNPDAGGYGVPAPVLKAVAAALNDLALTPDQTALVADVLWSMNVREARLTALALARSQPLEDVAARVLAWSDTTQDPDVLDELAGPALITLRRREAAAFLAMMEVGCRAPTGRQRAFALRALAEAAADRSFQELPEVLRLLPSGPEAPVGDEARALSRLVAELARRSPGETLRLLRERLERRQPAAYRLALIALPELPERGRSRLQRSLSAFRAAGIIGSSSD